jgi:hypothetical protein
MILQGIAVVVFVLAALPKFIGTAEARALFENLNVEPHGRIITASVEALAAILMLHPRSAHFGGLLGMAVMFCALGAHAFKLGFASLYGLFACLAVLVLALCAAIVMIRNA